MPADAFVATGGGMEHPGCDLAAEQPRIDSLGLQPEVTGTNIKPKAPEERRRSGVIVRSQNVAAPQLGGSMGLRTCG
jgi:hypothetical protein